MMLTFIISTIMGMASLEASTASQFDLVCSGVKRDQAKKDTGSGEPISVRIMVDIDRGLYAMPGFEAARKIHLVSPGEIVFQSIDHSGMYVNMSVNRSSGNLEWTIITTIKDGSSWVEATCQPSEFSGFPETKF